jgi:integrase
MSLKLIRYPKRSAHWYIRGTVRGQAIFETTGTDNESAAEAIRIKRENELLDRSVFGAGAIVTFAEAAMSYLAAGGEAKYLGCYDEKTGKWSLLIGELSRKPIAVIGQVESDAAAHKLYPATSSATRKRQVYAPLKAVLNHGAKKWKISVQRIENPIVKKVMPQWASPEQVRKLLPHCPPALRLFVAISVYTGERLEQVIALDWDEDIDLRQRTITFRYTKNSEMRTVHIAEALLVELSAVAECKRTGRVFHWSHKTHVHKPLRNACKRAGVPYLSPHKLGRHTCATWLRRYAKRDLRGLMEDLNWKSINSVVRYAHVVPGETAKAVELLPAVQESCIANVKPLKDRKTRRKFV